MEPNTWGVTVFALFVEFGSILGTFVSLSFYTPSLLAKQGELFFFSEYSVEGYGRVEDLESLCMS